ncbi:hypothetical protein ACS0TY_030042 [Phlomoides rotata]
MHVFLTLSAPSRLYLSDLCLSAAPPVAAHRSPPAAAVQQPPWAASGSCVTSLDVQKHLSPSPTYSHRSRQKTTHGAGTISKSTLTHHTGKLTRFWIRGNRSSSWDDTEFPTQLKYGF